MAVDGGYLGVVELIYLLIGNGGLAIGQGEGGDTGLICMPTNVAVGNQAGYPYSALAGVYRLVALLVDTHLRSLANEL